MHHLEQTLWLLQIIKKLLKAFFHYAAPKHKIILATAVYINAFVSVISYFYVGISQNLNRKKRYLNRIIRDLFSLLPLICLNIFQPFFFLIFLFFTKKIILRLIQQHLIKFVVMVVQYPHPEPIIIQPYLVDSSENSEWNFRSDQSVC